MTKEKDKFTDHEYDGIKELDNDLPRWWLYLFYFTIVWGLLYLIHYHVLATGDSSYAEYQKELDPDWQKEVKSSGLFTAYHSPFYSEHDLTPRIEMDRLTSGKTGEDSIFTDLIKRAMRRAEAENLNKLINAFPEIWEDLSAGNEPESKEKPQEAIAKTETKPEVEYQALTDASSLEAGKKIFATNCATCHGQAGEGGIGPNMTDNYWLHGGEFNNIVATITHGVPAKGMISWRGVLKEDQILQVASYLLTLQGTNPPNAKAPQGELYQIQ